ncbi:tetratricopeptide repeat protein [Pseudenhygromyxa sp. WMMC2535]|uniref:serine/threonine-protein kinase n=1 Tax=Pseudenhygromyxa sp. WMMC2535 TaxID=2712867 RepID=UPI001551E2EB|nr:serine/threonine-protein kinase [Pseudenhygromyxa sp. WMMC2535]NVB37416.1 tetratricopeptide repeat protein [Pseudenhygromyxa sp. WMMC2535]
MAVSDEVSDEVDEGITLSSARSSSARLLASALPPLREGVPRSVGRYLLLEEIGKGGMGTVYSAFDPELERTVAIKLIDAPTKRGDEGQGRRGDAYRRLRREAQAIAQVSHPNVIAVHDVGEFEFAGRRGLFMVMELIDGSDLSRWLGARERSVAEILDVFIQAGRGLEAAHAKGIVHRDFKPTNVLVDGRGRVRVLDFGLARGEGEGEGERGEAERGEEERDLDVGEIDESVAVARLLRERGEGKDSAGESAAALSVGRSRGSASMLSVPLTRHGAIMGTPRYMSPEQHMTAGVDARSDQYSFCLALYVALFRKLPFDESNAKALITSKFAGVQEWSAPEVPGHVIAALQRGLDLDPEQRWPDMGSLVAALADDPKGRRRRRIAVFAGVGALAVAVAAGVLWDRQAVASCADQRAWIEQAWGPRQVAAVEQAFSAVERPYAAKALEQVRGELDRYAEVLAGGHEGLCLDEHRGGLSDAVLAARAACFSEDLARLQAVVARFSAAGAEGGTKGQGGSEGVVERAAEVLSVLPDPEACAALERPQAHTVFDPAAREAIETELFDLELLSAAGERAAAIEHLGPLLERARSLDDAYTLTSVLIRAGSIQASVHEDEVAEQLLSEAVISAETLGAHDLAIDALTGLARALTDRRGRWDDAQRSLDFARAKYAREPGGSDGEWILHYIQASIHVQHERKPEAMAEYERALEFALGEPPMVRARILHALAFTEARAGKPEQAEAHAAESIALRVEVYGPEHPNLMYPLRAMAEIARDRGHYDDALARLDRARALGEARYGPDSVLLVEPHAEKAVTLRKLGRYEEALAEYEEAARLRRVNQDEDLGETLRMQSQVLTRLGRNEEALARADEALAEHREHHGSDEQVPWLRARFVMHRGEALLGLGRYREALIDFERAAELRTAEKSDSLLVRIWVGAGEACLGLGELERAAELFARARAHNEADEGEGGRTLARLDLGLARVSHDPDERRRLAQAAIAGFTDAGGDEDLAEAARAWLAEVEGDR